MIVSPGKWVSEEQLIALKGIKKGTLKKAREKSFMEGREYKHVAHCIDSLEVRKKPGGHWIIRDLMGLDLVGLASL